MTRRHLNPRLVRAAVSTTGVTILAAFVGLVVNVLMSRALGPAARGEVAWILQFAYVVSPVLAFGKNREALTGWSPKHSLFPLWLPVVVLVGASLTVAADVVSAIVAVAASGAATSILYGITYRQNRIRRYVAVQSAVQLWILLGAITLFALGVKDVDYWVVVYAVPAVVFLLAALPAMVSGAPGHWVPSLRDWFTRTSAQRMAGGLAILLAGRTERLQLPLWASLDSLGVYVALATASEFVTWAAKGLGDGRVATSAVTSTNRSELARVLLRDLFVFTCMAVPVAAGMMWVLLPLLGPAFVSGTSLIIPLCVSAIAWSCYFQVSSTWLARAAGRSSMSLDVSTAILTTVCAATLIPSFGAAGAAWACALAYSIMTVVGVLRAPVPTVGAA